MNINRILKSSTAKHVLNQNNSTAFNIFFESLESAYTATRAEALYLHQIDIQLDGIFGIKFTDSEVASTIIKNFAKIRKEQATAWLGEKLSDSGFQISQQLSNDQVVYMVNFAFPVNFVLPNGKVSGYYHVPLFIISLIEYLKLQFGALISKDNCHHTIRISDTPVCERQVALSHAMHQVGLNYRDICSNQIYEENGWPYPSVHDVKYKILLMGEIL